MLGKFAWRKLFGNFTTSYTEINKIIGDKSNWYKISYPCWLSKYDISYLS